MVSVVVIASIGLAACGGGSKSDKSTDDSGGNGDATSVPAGQDASSSGSSASPSGTDKNYVADVCKAIQDFTAAYEKIATADATKLSDPKTIAPAFTAYAKALGKANPPVTSRSSTRSWWQRWTPRQKTWPKAKGSKN